MFSFFYLRIEILARYHPDTTGNLPTALSPPFHLPLHHPSPSLTIPQHKHTQHNIAKDKIDL
jgi:hypothetical protein